MRTTVNGGLCGLCGAAGPQELSVWAGGANSAQQQQRQQQSWGPDLRSGSSDVVSAEATGLIARNLMGAYAELRCVLEAVATIMAQHEALKVRDMATASTGCGEQAVWSACFAIWSVRVPVLFGTVVAQT